MFFKKKAAETIIPQKIKERDLFLKNFQRYLRNYQNLVLFIHEKPDGDCLGGAFGLKEVLKTQFHSKNIYVVGGSQGSLPWLHTEFDDLPSDFDFSTAAAIILDAGVSTRIQKFKEYFKDLGTRKWGAVIRIDHHDGALDYYTDLAWVDGSYAACCAQLVQICDYYQWEMNCKSATYFFLGILTDSSFFTNTEVSPRTFVLAAKALRAGADREFLVENIKRVTKLELQLRNQILSNYVQEERFVWYFMTKDIMAKYEPYSSSSNQVGCLGHIENNVLWMLFAEFPDGSIRVSFRSVGSLDVRILAEEFGGGGHINAAGATLTDAQQVSEVVSRARTFVQQASEKDLESKDETSRKLREEVEDTINPAYRLELTPEEKKALEITRRLMQESKMDTEKKSRIEEWEKSIDGGATDVNSWFSGGVKSSSGSDQLQSESSELFPSKDRSE